MGKQSLKDVMALQRMPNSEVSEDNVNPTEKPGTRYSCASAAFHVNADGSTTEL